MVFFYALSALLGGGTAVWAALQILDLQGRRDVFIARRTEPASARSNQLQVGGVAAEADLRAVRPGVFSFEQGASRGPSRFRFFSLTALALAFGFFGAAGFVASLSSVGPQRTLYIALCASLLGYLVATALRFLRWKWD